MDERSSWTAQYSFRLWSGGEDGREICGRKMRCAPLSDAAWKYSEHMSGWSSGFYELIKEWVKCLFIPSRAYSWVNVEWQVLRARGACSKYACELQVTFAWLDWRSFKSFSERVSDWREQQDSAKRSWSCWEFLSDLGEDTSSSENSRRNKEKCLRWKTKVLRVWKSSFPYLKGLRILFEVFPWMMTATSFR